jgi:hypothetical protein
MSNATTVTLTAGVPTAPSGTVSTLDNLIGIAGTPSAQVQSVQGVAGGTAVPVSIASLPSAAVTNAGTFAVQVTAATPAGTNVIGHVIVDTAPTTAVTLATAPALVAGSAIIGKVGIDQTTPGTTNGVAINAALPAGTNAIGSVTISNANANGRALPASSAPVVLNSQTYKAVAASATATLFGTTGASGDYLDGVLIIPATAAAGVVSITDGSGSAITIFAGGGTTALPTLAPFYVPIGAVSSGGAGGWKVTTGANVSVIGVGNFT